MDPSPPDARQKALALNLDPASYGTIAEIGGGQEVARWFFQVGGAAGTVAKTISAYDMAVSDALQELRVLVLQHRLQALPADVALGVPVERLGDTRSPTTTFFAFADTVATRSYTHPEDGRGWVGIWFQTRPREDPSEILVHVNLLDSTTVLQQAALGVLGVNLIHGAFFHHARPDTLIGSLLDDLSRARLDVDMIRFSGPAFAGLDNRLMSLQLVEQGLTDAMRSAA